jgi:hypothetical protein
LNSINADVFDSNAAAAAYVLRVASCLLCHFDAGEAVYGTEHSSTAAALSLLAEPLFGSA